MCIYKLERTQIIKLDIDSAWKFFSDPKNLKTITPENLGFNITSTNISEEIYAGMIITYTVSPILKIPMTWMTEITHVDKNKLFVDEQRAGPYKIWHHEHHFREVADGCVETRDLVHYVLPFGLIGKVVREIVVKKQLEEIFNFREKKLIELFGEG